MASKVLKKFNLEKELKVIVTIKSHVRVAITLPVDHEVIVLEDSAIPHDSKHRVKTMICGRVFYCYSNRSQFVFKPLAGESDSPSYLSSWAVDNLIKRLNSGIDSTTGENRPEFLSWCNDDENYACFKEFLTI
jgi:hypothetical protein